MIAFGPGIPWIDPETGRTVVELAWPGRQIHAVSSKEFTGAWHTVSDGPSASGRCTHPVMFSKNATSAPTAIGCVHVTAAMNYHKAKVAARMAAHGDTSATEVETVPARPTLRERLAEPVGTGKGLYG